MTDITNILIDWGTSRFRLWGVNSRGETLIRLEEPLGMSKLTPSDYEPRLESILAKFDIAETVPVLICGMAGSAQGWQEAKYIDIPTRLDQLSTHAVKVKTARRPVKILPGLAQRSEQHPDVIRGEETLLLGAFISGYSYDLYCLPGTHSKWVEVTDGDVQQIKTTMTGELFALLSTQSTLAHFMDKPSRLHEQEDFKAAINESQSNPEQFLSRLFTIRAKPLLFASKENAAARLSGLLIGSELSAINVSPKTKIGLIATAPLADLYATALADRGLEAEQIDSEELALAGLKFAANINGVENASG